MDPEDKLLPKVSSLSSSAQSTPEKNGQSDDVSRSPELLQEFLKPGPKKDLVQTCFDKVKISSGSSKGKMKEVPKPTSRTTKKQDTRKASNCLSSQPSAKKQNRKGENPIRFPPNPEQPSEFGFSNSWICKNSACRAVLSMDDAFCKRCSCCICHLFDDNKDPSLWLVCSSESGKEGSCGLSCHIECALQREKVGVVDLGQLMRLDGSYCCASCGKVSGIIGNLKKQLIIAKDARRVDILCYRIYLSYRLLNGTARFKELLEIVKDAKAKLETDVGPVDGVSAKMARGIVSRLSVAGAVQDLCSLAIEKAEEWLSAVSDGNSNCREDSLPAACKFLFEEITCSSVTVILVELPKPLSNEIMGYKLWYYRSGEETRGEEPVCVFPRDQRRIRISNLQPCTEYTFRIVSHTESGDLGHSEAKCFTKSIEIIPSNPRSSVPKSFKAEPKNSSGDSSGFKVRELGKVLHLAWAQEQGYLEDSCFPNTENCYDVCKISEPENGTRDQLPDLNEEFNPPFESSRDENTTSHDEEKNNLVGSNGSGDSLTWTGGEGPDVDSQRESSKKRGASSNETETHDCDSTLINGSPLHNSDSSGCLDENFEYCVKIIRGLECEGHINQEFRLRLLTWFSLRSTEQERRVVNTFIQTMIDDPVSLAGQLVDTFSDIVSCKRPRNGF